MSVINPIDTNLIVTPINRPGDTVKDASSWFREEKLELNFGETTGRPDSDITLQREYLARFLETGWTICEVIEKSDGGYWANVGGSKTVNKNQSFIPDYQNSGMASTSFGGLDHDLYYQTKGIGWVNRSSKYTNNKECTTPVTVTQSETTPNGEAPAYWTSYQKIQLKRRRIVGELVLNSMLKSFGNAYNSGREVEDSRYNQVVSLYMLMLQRSENEGNAILTEAFDAAEFLNDIKGRVLKSIDRADASGKSASDNIIKAALESINREYDAKVAMERARQITVGLYNSTIWPTVEAAYERQRQAAIVAARAEGEKSVFEINRTSSESLGNVGVQLANAAATISKSIDDRKMSVTELRNNVLKWMLDYIGGRQESYPELEEQATISEQIGFSNNAAISNAL